MAERKPQELLDIKVARPSHDFRATVYVPQKNCAVQSEIIGYRYSFLWNFYGAINDNYSYILDRHVLLERGDCPKLTNHVYDREVFSNREDAEKAGRFFEVTATEEEWALAIGNEPVKATDRWSPYSHEPPEFRLCGNWSSDVRDSLACCRKFGGMLAYNRNWLKRIIDDDECSAKNFSWDSPLGSIFKQLEVSPYL